MDRSLITSRRGGDGGGGWGAGVLEEEYNFLRDLILGGQF